MKIEIDLQEIMKSENFANALAYEVAERMNWNLREDWANEFIENFRKRLDEVTKEAVNELIKDKSDFIKNEIEKALSRLTKSEVVELIKGGKLSDLPF